MRKTITFRILLLVLIVISFIASILLFINANSYPRAVPDNIMERYPFRYEDDQTYWSELSDIAVCGDHLYVLYDAKRVMSCYSLDGSYLCSFAFNTIKNGQAEFYCIDETIFLESKGHDFYSFSGVDFLHFYDSREDSEQIKVLKDQFDMQRDLHISDTGEKYEIRRASVWKTSTDGVESEIIHRPSWLIIFQNGIYVFLGVALWFTVILLLKGLRK